MKSDCEGAEKAKKQPVIALKFDNLSCYKIDYDYTSFRVRNQLTFIKFIGFFSKRRGEGEIGRL